MNDQAIKSLAAAVMLQAVKDYFKMAQSKRAEIIKDLRSRWMQDLSGGMSLVVAEQLLKHPAEIRARVLVFEKDENEV